MQIKQANGKGEQNQTVKSQVHGATARAAQSPDWEKSIFQCQHYR